MNKLKIIIADDQALMREGLQTILELEEDIEVIGTATNGQQALELIEYIQPDIALLDIQMPIMDGIQCARRAKESCPHTIVLLLSTFIDEQYIIEGMTSGANGYLLKDMDSRQLVQAIRDAARGHVMMPATLTTKLATKLASMNLLETQNSNDINTVKYKFTPREQAIITLMIQGVSNKHIAQQLFIHQGTLRNYISQIYAKLGVNDRVSALLLLQKNKE